MVYTCFLCKWRSDKYPRRSYHKFPSNEELKLKWLDILGKNNVTIGKRTSLCCLHFEEECFNYGSVQGRRVLRDGSLPTLYLTRSNMREEVDIVDKNRTEFLDNNLPASYLTEGGVKIEPTSLIDGEEYDVEVLRDSCSPKRSFRKRKLNSQAPTLKSEITSATSSEPVDVRPFINLPTHQPFNPSFTTKTTSQYTRLHDRSSILSDGSSSSTSFTPEENLSFFQFFRSIHSDYLELSAKRKRHFKRQCLNFLYSLLDDDTNHQVLTYSQDNLNLLNSCNINVEKDVKPVVEDDYILPNN